MKPDTLYTGTDEQCQIKWIFYYHTERMAPNTGGQYLPQAPGVERKLEYLDGTRWGRRLIRAAGSQGVSKAMKRDARFCKRLAADLEEDVWGAAVSYPAGKSINHTSSTYPMDWRDLSVHDHFPCANGLYLPFGREFAQRVQRGDALGAAIALTWAYDRCLANYYQGFDNVAHCYGKWA